MKVIFLGDSISSQRSGIHYYGLQLVHHILRVFPHHQYSIIATDKIDLLPIEQTVVPVDNKIPGHLRWRQLVSIPAIINRINPDLVVELAHFGPFNLKRGIKRVTVVHDLTPIRFPQFHPWSSVLAHKLLLHRIVKRSEFIIVNSEHTKMDLLQLFDKDPQSVSIFYPEIPEGTDHHEDQLVPGERPYFLTVGTREPRKNHLTILRSFEKFCEVNRDFDLVIAGGKGWKNQQFEKAWKCSPAKNRIRITGYISRVALETLYQNAYAFIFASIYEGFGLPILEAQSYALPLILSDNPSIPPFARESALLFETYDDLSLCRHMTMLAENQEEQKKLRLRSKEAFESYKSHSSNLSKIFSTPI